jgi:S-formylglutathione hydrolase
VPIDGDDSSWDIGTGAGFYVDATEEKWATNYNMCVRFRPHNLLL